jgi:hypothetical protein
LHWNLWQSWKQWSIGRMESIIALKFMAVMETTWSIGTMESIVAMKLWHPWK